MKRPIVFAFAFGLFGVFYYLVTPQKAAPNNQFELGSLSSGKPTAPQTVTPTETAAVADIKSEPQAELKSVWKLDEGNFEHHVQYCFQGDACELNEDVWALYNAFKKAGRKGLIHNLIALLRRDLKNPEWSKKYKNTVKQMIDDAYAEDPQEKAMQMAAFHNYAGDLEKSLDLYLEIERAAKTDPSIEAPFPLNIANTYFDLGRKSEALRYYEAALREHLNLKGPHQDDVIRYIESRIHDIKFPRQS